MHMTRMGKRSLYDLPPWMVRNDLSQEFESHTCAGGLWGARRYVLQLPELRHIRPQLGRLQKAKQTIGLRLWIGQIEPLSHLVEIRQGPSCSCKKKYMSVFVFMWTDETVRKMNLIFGRQLKTTKWIIATGFYQDRKLAFQKFSLNKRRQQIFIYNFCTGTDPHLIDKR